MGLRDDLTAGQFEGALHELESNTKEKDRLLTLLEKAQVEHYAGQWTASNDNFELAENKEVWVKYVNSEYQVSICMVGQIVKIEGIWDR